MPCVQPSTGRRLKHLMYHSCTNATNILQCLRELPYETIYNSAYEGLEWFATIDDIFITEYPQLSYQSGKLAKVPILLGTNTDEGTSFGTTGTDTDDECIEQLICQSSTLTLDRPFRAMHRTNNIPQHPNAGSSPATKPQPFCPTTPTSPPWAVPTAGATSPGPRWACSTSGTSPWRGI